jgi:hypothetical protein
MFGRLSAQLRIRTRAVPKLAASNDYAADLCAKHLFEKEIAWILHFFENGSLSLLERFSWSTS